MFKPMTEPYVCGYSATRDDGFTVEVIRCYAGRWNVFLTMNGMVTARSIDAYKLYGNGYTTKRQATRLAKQLMKGR
jgi:hypothetical protein